MQESLQERAASDVPLTFELMFDSRKKRNLSARLADAIDLVIDFSTLGEYGLEPVDQTAAPVCGARRRRSRQASGIGFAAIDRGDHLPARL